MTEEEIYKACLEKWGLPAQPIDTEVKNAYVHPSWTEQELINTMRYYSRLIWYGQFSFEQYSETFRRMEHDEENT